MRTSNWRLQSTNGALPCDWMPSSFAAWSNFPAANITFFRAKLNLSTCQHDFFTRQHDFFACEIASFLRLNKVSLCMNWTQGVYMMQKIYYLTTNKGVTESMSFNLRFSLWIYKNKRINVNFKKYSECVDKFSYIDVVYLIFVSFI